MLFAGFRPSDRAPYAIFEDPEKKHGIKEWSSHPFTLVTRRIYMMRDLNLARYIDHQIRPVPPLPDAEELQPERGDHVKEPMGVETRRLRYAYRSWYRLSAGLGDHPW